MPGPPAAWGQQAGCCCCCWPLQAPQAAAAVGAERQLLQAAALLHRGLAALRAAVVRKQRFCELCGAWGLGGWQASRRASKLAVRSFHWHAGYTDKRLAPSS